jgi:hypothetical protein
MARRRRIDYFSTHLGVRVTIETSGGQTALVLRPPAGALIVSVPLDAADLDDFRLLIDTAAERLVKASPSLELPQAR